MNGRLPVQFWIETALAAVSGGLTIVTLVWRDWIEAVLHVDPDAHSGAAEWTIVGIALAVTIAAIVTAGRDWARARAVTSRGAI